MDDYEFGGELKEMNEDNNGDNDQTPNTEKKEDKKEDKKEEKNKEAIDSKEEKEEEEEEDPGLKEKLENEDFFIRPINNFKNKVFKYNFKKKQIEKFKKTTFDSYGLFFCYKSNGLGGECMGEQICCPVCMKKNQKLYGLMKHYLVNDRGRICTFKNNSIYCKGKFKKKDKQNNIDYSFYYVCGHSGQCDACKRLTKVMDKYYDSNLLEKLRKRDKKYL